MEENSESDRAAKKAKHDERLAAFEGVLLFSRWLQLPLLIGLVVALLVFEFKFLERLVKTLFKFDTITPQQAILVTLDLIDMVLIANLVVMVVISGYETFISRLHLVGESNVPVWMRRSTAGQLKLRIATTILLISTIHLLHMYLDPTRVDQAEVNFMLIAQVLFVVTAGAFVLFDWLENMTHHSDVT